MLWLYLLLGFLILLLVLLCIPIRVRFTYRESLSLEFRYLFVKYQPNRQKQESEDTSPQPKKPKKQKKKHKKQSDKTSEKSNPIQKMIQQNGRSGFLEMLLEVAKMASGWGKKIFSHIRLTVFELELFVGGEDAADAANRYGQTCAVVYPAISLLFQAMKVHEKKKRISVQLMPDFFTLENAVDFVGAIRISPIWVLTSGISALFRFLGYMIRMNIKKIRKGTMNDE